MKRAASVILQSVLLALLVADWVFLGNVGARNGSVFIIWLIGVIGIVCFLAIGRVPAIRKRSLFVSAIVGSCEIAVIGMLVWHGEFLLASVYLFGCFGAAAVRGEASKRFAQDAKAA